METWITLFFVATGGLGMGVGLTWMRYEAKPSLASLACTVIGLMTVVMNGSVIAHKLGLI